MHYFIEYHIKDPKLFWSQWEKAQGALPKDCHFIQAYSSKDMGVCIGVWQAGSEKVLKAFTKEYFSLCATSKCHEIDEYHVEGEPLRDVG
ncbi:MAG: hypothetical protein S4CHLAM37_08940 [Chlamydiia bacterium]|nr:hypothetical protein [Chlamydiia bacterium]